MKQILGLLFFLLLFSPVFCLANDKIDLNTASLSQLDEITGVGPVLGQRIINARPFSSVDDLLRVKGIGEKTLQKIKEQGLAYVKTQTEQGVKEIKAESLTTDITYPSGVVINEILPNPEGPDETNEWIEMYNSNDFDVDLSSWTLKDTNGTIKIYTIPKDTIIPANGFLVFKRPDTEIMLNNDEDGLSLSAPDNKIIDSASYKKAPLNQSYNKINSGRQWSKALTPNTVNVIAAAPSKGSTENLSKTENSVKNNNVETGLAGISRSINMSQEAVKNLNPWFLFFTALAVTIISATVVLFIKLKIKKI